MNTLNSVACCEDVRTPIVTKLHNIKDRMERDLKDVNDAIAALEKNPEITNVLELLQRTTGRFCG